MNSYEIEIKSLLGSLANAERLVQKMKAKDDKLAQTSSHKQLNHYFVGGNLENLRKNADHLIIGPKDKAKFEEVIKKAKTFSVRTRLADKKLLLVVKASIDDTTSSNGTARIEFETEIKGLTLDELDKLILESGFEYQAKWSRERTDYKFRDVSVSIDKNAGYGYIAEFEKVVNDPGLADGVKKELRELIQELGAEELAQDRLERMFAHYNAHWRDYYGTDKIFSLD
ncbi:MAG: hypothetical protein A3B23_02905 [Candidatus Colwellbacteria bacterium RIFCSPLOWO2_01_FULL_48_10]|uniref:CYTH domain-containing protein n=1 Tax=Candidatus Colwellbacteria bacterium RIFCSPLOWO2_01_FULL_48_10 TaxID=1797690 RepID=A0A1G1Z646_9BACT|nr:MAG: hypothetical protein A3B23_02905 [Candidatus Colwellbacteria bacterium RIFCSPLOWO2_01_FULL_48_10]